MKKLDLVFEEEDFKRLKKVKLATGKKWETYLLDTCLAEDQNVPKKPM